MMYTFRDREKYTADWFKYVFSAVTIWQMSAQVSKMHTCSNSKNGILEITVCAAQLLISVKV